MTPQQAYELLDRATALITANRQDHIAIQEALNVLKPVEAPKSDDKTPDEGKLDE